MLALCPAVRDERDVVAQLMQLYAYDWSERLPLDVGDDGRFAAYPTLDAYWQEDGRHPFLLRVDGALAGFALVSATSRLNGAPGVHDVAELFVMRRYRRQGAGRAAAFALFDRFPGAWEVRQRDENTAATAFWRRTIAAYTGGRYEEVAWDDAAWRGPVQRFTAPGAGAAGAR